MSLRPIACLLLMTVGVAGCAGSRWAKGDLEYDRKYPVHTGNLGRMAKQSIDARSVTAGRTGWYSAIAASDSPAAGEIAVGAYGYPEDYEGVVETRVGLRGIALADDDGGIAGGLELGGRLQSPTRLAPFHGASFFLGGSSLDWAFQESGEGTDYDLAAAFSPEAGLHYWLTPEWRLTASIAHTFIDFDGPGHGDYTLYGVSLAYLNIPGFRSPLLAPGDSIDCGRPLAPALIRRLPPTEPPEGVVDDDRSGAQPNYAELLGANP